MKGAESKFLKFVKALRRIYTKAIPELVGRELMVSKSGIINNLFSIEEEYKESLTKLDNNKIWINNTHIEALIETSVDLEDEYSFFDPIAPKILKPVENDVGESDLEIERLKTQQEDAHNYAQCLYEALKKKFPISMPYPWVRRDIMKLKKVNKENNEYKLYVIMIFHYLLYFSVFYGLRYNNINSGFKAVTTNEFELFLKENKRIVLKGDRYSGKTNFIKSLANKHRDTIFYLDSNYKTISNEDVFLTLRPDYKFWCKSDICKKIKEYENEEHEKKTETIVLPFLPDNAYSDDDFYKKYLHNIPKNETLIIDHVEDLSIIKKLENLPCRVVFVLNSNIDCSAYNVEEYIFDNKEIAKDIIKKVYSELKDDNFSALYSKIGTNIFLYHVIAATHKKCDKKYPDFNFIDKLCSIESFDAYDELFVNSGEEISISVSINYGNHKRTGQCFEKHIVSTYEKYFDDEEKYSKPSEDRTNAVQLQLLRLLCRLKYKNIAYSDFKEYYGEDELCRKIEDLNWVKDDRICIPDIVAYAFNRKDNINDPQYAEALNIRFSLALAQVHSSTKPVNKKLYTEILRCLFEDINYLNKKAKKINTKYTNTITYTESYELYKDGERKIKIAEDDISQTVSLHKQNYEYVIYSTLWYAYEYEEKDLFDDIYVYAKETIRDKAYFELLDIVLSASKEKQTVFDINEKIKNIEENFDVNILSIWLLLDFYGMQTSHCVFNYFNKFNRIGLTAKEFFECSIEFMNSINNICGNMLKFVSKHEEIFIKNKITIESDSYQDYLRYKVINIICNNVRLAVTERKLTKDYQILKELLSENKLAVKVAKLYFVLTVILILVNGEVEMLVNDEGELQITEKLENLDCNLSDLITEFYFIKEYIGDSPEHIRRLSYLAEEYIAKRE